MKIVVIEAFGLHLGYLGCYGNDWVATPNLDRLALEAIVFDWHFADQPELEPTTPWNERNVGCSTLPRVVRCESLTRFAVQAMRAIKANDGWLWIEGPSLLPPWSLKPEILEAYFDEEDTEDEVTPWLDPPCDVVTLSDTDTIRLQNTYAAAVSFFDVQLGTVLDYLGDDETTLLCVTARSGLPLGEHGMIGTPRPCLHDELVHLPLLMRMPKREDAGLRIAALTQPMDVVPTLREALGQPIPDMSGHSLWPLIRGEVEAVRPHAIARMRVGERESGLLRTLDRALHVDLSAETPDSPRLFIKPEDRWEVNDLYTQYVESADALEKVLRAHRFG